ncbi:MAG TPA: ABC transporter ATP-binding protein [Thermomicrobiaceae bacterium]|nr:ABC transporter ATP-binding protein [Thermomicrobiaceae bacterium]
MNASEALQAPVAPPQASVAPPPAVETHGLRKVYGAKVAVADLTIRVEPGEIFGFLGPNGAGKSTSIKMLVGLVHPSAGSARLLGRPLGDRQARARIGYLPELFRFHDWLSGEEFLDLHGELYGMSRTARRSRIPEVLALVGLKEAGRQRIRTYSKGMQQRVGLAQALLNDPRLVFLDEPTSALDPLGRRDVRAIIGRLKAEGVTVFLNSHLLSEVETSCDRVAIISQGRVAAIGGVAELLRQELTVELRLGGLDAEALAALRELLPIEHVSTGEPSLVLVRAADEAAIARGVDLLVRRGVAVYGVTPERRTLEEVFLDVVAGAGSDS